MQIDEKKPRVVTVIVGVADAIMVIFVAKDIAECVDDIMDVFSRTTESHFLLNTGGYMGA